ncbi:hypothetical protein BDZ94DRAFT_1236071 [Collybia nuda]|uniref:Uncharacterized protein n=1 Tax=Collybia nuda TaxID=64659 RepID=A0A9P5Y7C3_9AGAR|nr:hypothetical protein BDZ94DRAFT_1236071 [Collybia nuda]
MEAKMKKMKAELIFLRKAIHTKAQEKNLIPHPPHGVAGNGYNLKAAMQLQDDTKLYKAIWKCGYTTKTGNPIGGSNDDDGAYKDHEMNIDIDEHERDKVDSGDEGGGGGPGG